MAIPNLDEIRRPALELLAERGKLTNISDVFDLLAPAFALTDEDCEGCYLAELNGVGTTGWTGRATI